VIMAAGRPRGRGGPTHRSLLTARTARSRSPRRVIGDWKPFGWLHLQRGAAELFQRRLHQGRDAAGQGAATTSTSPASASAQPVGLGLPGESRGQLRAPPQWSALSLATMSIGQEISVTAVQMVTAFAAIANGGRLMQPQIVRALLDANGREVPDLRAQSRPPGHLARDGRASSPPSHAVVREGTGHNAAIPGYEVAGKTGTAQKMDPSTRRYSHAPGISLLRGLRPRGRSAHRHDRPPRRAQGTRSGAARRPHPSLPPSAREALRHLKRAPRGTMPVHLLARRGGIAGTGWDGRARAAREPRCRSGRPRGHAGARGPLAAPGHGGPRALRT